MKKILTTITAAALMLGVLAGGTAEAKGKPAPAPTEKPIIWDTCQGDPDCEHVGG